MKRQKRLKLFDFSFVMPMFQPSRGRDSQQHPGHLGSKGSYSFISSPDSSQSMTSENYAFACDGKTFRLIRNRVSLVSLFVHSLQ